MSCKRLLAVKKNYGSYSTSSHSLSHTSFTSTVWSSALKSFFVFLLFYSPFFLIDYKINFVSGANSVPLIKRCKCKTTVLWGRKQPRNDIMKNPRSWCRARLDHPWAITLNFFFVASCILKKILEEKKVSKCLEECRSSSNRWIDWLYLSSCKLPFMNWFTRNKGTGIFYIYVF